MNGYLIDKERLPADWPTHLHAPDFWEQLGRTVATYGFLEDVLCKAIFALTATKPFASKAEAKAAYDEWVSNMERALTGVLKQLADQYKRAIDQHPNSTLKNADELVVEIKKAADLRNAICHGSWGAPDQNGYSRIFYVDKKMRMLDTPIDINYLKTLQMAVAELTVEVINSVSHMGIQFPGFGGLGEPICSDNQ